MLYIVFFGSIFYQHNVVGGVVSDKNVITGGRIRRTVPLLLRIPVYAVV